MRHISIGLASICLAVSIPALADDPAVREFGEDRVISVLINGRQTPIEVAPNGANAVIVIPEVAQELGLKGSMIGGVRMVGNTRFAAESNVVRIGFDGDKPVKRRMFWFDQPWADAGEGRIGPATLPDPVVMFRIAPTVPGERIITLPMKDQGYRGIVSPMTVGGQEVLAYFSFERGETMLTASTGALFANSFAGRLTGTPRDMPIELGVTRAVQPMVFDNPIMLGDLPLTSFVVRTQDTGSIGDIPIDDEAAQDMDEIVVTAESKRKVQHRIVIGTDSLQGCSTLTFDKPAKQIRLSCSPR